MSASPNDMIWYRQKYQTIIDEMARLGHTVTIEQIRTIVAKEKNDRKARMAGGYR